jgi:serine/threonine-protein kinase
MDAGEIRRQTERVLSSRTFTASGRMSRFLRFAVERTLEGRGGELKEYLLGVEIFDREESFDPRVDPIVRVEARRLRSKLKSFYENEGSCDPLVIELPTGSYVPRFRIRGSEPSPASVAPERNIAVLPFTNLSPDPDTDYFSDGLTEELIHALTKVEGLRVVAWNTASRLKDRQDDPTGIGRQLNVATVLVGSVRSSGGRIRVMARLIETSSGYYLWSETYDRQIEDLFAIQEEISRAIVDTLRVQFIGSRAGQGMARSPSNLVAYNLYLKGRFHWNKRTREGLERAIQHFRKAVSVDPAFAAGYAGVADAYTLLADHGLARPAEVMAEAKSAALRALELDPLLAEAYASLALIRSLYEWQWGEAGQHYRRAMQLSPGYVTAHHWYACDYLALLGRMDEALDEIDIAIQLDPLSHVMNESRAYVLMLARRYDESLEQIKRVTELNPFFFKVYTHTARTYIQMGRYGEAIELLKKGRALAPDVPSLFGALGQAHALAGQAADARAVLDEMAALAKTVHVPSTAFALTHLGLGDKERALEWLEKGCAAHELTVAALKVHPAYDELRGEPRFEALVKTIGLGD